MLDLFYLFTACGTLSSILSCFFSYYLFYLYLRDCDRGAAARGQAPAAPPQEKHGKCRLLSNIKQNSRCILKNHSLLLSQERSFRRASLKNFILSFGQKDDESENNGFLGHLFGLNKRKERKYLDIF
jgi:hypothetical protein